MIKITDARVVIVHEHNDNFAYHSLIWICRKATAYKLPIGNTFIKVKIIIFRCSVLAAIMVIDFNSNAKQTGSGICLRGSFSPA